jgi:hypothetical protein
MIESRLCVALECTNPASGYIDVPLKASSFVRLAICENCRPQFEEKIVRLAPVSQSQTAKFKTTPAEGFNLAEALRNE